LSRSKYLFVVSLLLPRGTLAEASHARPIHFGIPLPVLIVNVSLFQSLTDLLLILRRKFLKAVNGVQILRVTTRFLNGFIEVADDLRRDASPGRVSVILRV
jgi:hypothetical protein